MISITFNTVVELLEREFHIEGARLRPDTRLAELGFDASGMHDFLLAIEDAFRLHLPAGRFAQRDPATDLLALCEALEALVQSDVQPAPGVRPSSAATVALLSTPQRAASAATAAHSPSR